MRGRLGALALALLGAGGCQRPAATVELEAGLTSHAFTLSGQTPATMPLRFSNRGDVRSGPLVTTFSDEAGAFGVVDDQCAGLRLAVGNSCEVDVLLRSVAAGDAYQARLVVSDPGHAGAQAATQLTGDVTPTRMVLGLSTGSTDTLTVAQGASKAVLLTASNLGGALSGMLTASSDSPLVTLTGDCLGQRIMSGETCQLAVTATVPGDAPLGSSTLTVMLDDGAGDTATHALTLVITPPPET